VFVRGRKEGGAGVWLDVINSQVMADDEVAQACATLLPRPVSGDTSWSQAFYLILDNELKSRTP